MEKLFDKLIAANAENVEKILEDFIEKASQTFTFPELNQKDRRKKVWKSLYEIATKTDNPQLLIKCFATVRILSREKSGLSELITEEWLDLMKTHCGLKDVNYTFDNDKALVAAEVQKCMSNIIFNSSVALAMACKNHILDGIMKRMKRYKEPDFPEDVKIFDMKLVFLITALCPEMRNKLKNEFHSVQCLTNQLELILKEAAENQNRDEKAPIICLSDKQVDLADEILKALFNLTLHYGEVEEEPYCMTIVQMIRNYLLVPTPSKEKTRRLQNDVINLLTNMPLESYSELMVPVQEGQKIPKMLQYDGKNMTPLYEILMVLKEKFSDEPNVGDQIIVLSPVITAILKCATSNRAMRKYLRTKILPPLTDVHSRPEQGDTLRNCLCRLLTSPVTQLKDITAELLFVLCKKSVQRMIKYTGYGNAAGLFAQRGLLGGRADEGEADFSSDSGGSETEEYAEFKHGINPVTGCFEVPHPDPMEHMSEEQKEYEAMKLVELIDNLTKTGTIKPCRIGADGKPEPIEHVLQLQAGLKSQQINRDYSSDSD